MAKNVSLMGADYPAVPAVQLPQTGGGTATFYDIQVVDNLNSTSGTDALSANQGRVLNDTVKNIGFYDTTNEITNLSDIPVNSFGRIKLSSALKPTSYTSNYNYICIGESGNRTLILYRPTSDGQQTWIAQYTSGAWSMLWKPTIPYHGIKTAVSVAAGAEVEWTINFSTAFPSGYTPSVTFVPTCEDGYAGNIIAHLRYNSRTGFTVILKNTANTALNIGLSWMAI